MIRMNDFGRLWSETSSEMQAVLNQVGQKGIYILGDEVRAFEHELTEFWGLKYAVGVANGLDAIEIALRVCGISAGDEVLTTPYSAFATTLAILRVGAIPIFVDTDINGLIDLDQCEDYLKKNSCRCLIPVDLFGAMPDNEKLKSLKEKFGLTVIEDAAQSIGAKSKGKSPGTGLAFATTSFYPTKNLGCMGDGGALLTDNEGHARVASQVRHYGQSKRYEHSVDGLNSRLDELQAGFLRQVYLKRLSKWTSRRREIAARYSEVIGKHSRDIIRAIPESGGSWHLFPVFVSGDYKPAFERHMASNEVETASHYPSVLTDQPVMKKHRFHSVNSLPVARRLVSEEVSLPINPYLTDQEIRHVCAAIEGFKG